MKPVAKTRNTIRYAKNVEQYMARVLRVPVSEEYAQEVMLERGKGKFKDFLQRERGAVAKKKQ